MSTRHAIGPLLLALGFAGGCGDDEQVAIDAAVGDAGPDATMIDAGQVGAVVCESEAQRCPTPGQICCDTQPGPDRCTAADVPCAGQTMACDGPEDCAATEDCCLWSNGSRCTAAGICGNTGSITEVMCHLPADCPIEAPSCCGTAPGPLLDLYFVCRQGGCPQ